MKVSDNCRTFDILGECTACYIGYRLNSEGACELRNLICKSEDAIGRCTSCYGGYILYRNACTPLSQLADIALYYA